MCLKIDKAKTSLMLQEHAQNGVKECTFFKVFTLVDGSKVIPLYQRQYSYDGDVVDEGGYCTARKNPIVSEDKGYVGTGAYHAYCDSEGSKKCRVFTMACYPEVVVREVRVPVSSIIGYGDSGDVAFTKMKICFEAGEHV